MVLAGYPGIPGGRQFCCWWDPGQSAGGSTWVVVTASGCCAGIGITAEEPSGSGSAVGAVAVWRRAIATAYWALVSAAAQLVQKSRSGTLLAYAAGAKPRGRMMREASTATGGRRGAALCGWRQWAVGLDCAPHLRQGAAGDVQRHGDCMGLSGWQPAVGGWSESCVWTLGLIYM